MARILLVEDDALLARGIGGLLKLQGYAVDVVTRGEEALAVGAREPYGAVLLDLGLPDMSGIDVLQAWRRGGVRLPVLILTARDAVADRVRGLDAGADDYLTKPFESDELLARIRALVRRGQSLPSARVQVGLLSCDPVTQLAELDGRILDLPRREWAVLYALVTRAGQVVSRERLSGEVFGFDEPVGDNALEVYIARLRKKLQPLGPTIRNLRGLGYMLNP